MKKYCHLCGALYIEGKTQPWECSGCGNLSFENATPTADILLFNSKGQALLAKRGVEPSKGKYDFPGGFVDLGETFEEAMKREAVEELGLKPEDYTEPTFVCSQAGTYEFSRETKPIVSVTFAAKLLSDKNLKPQDDVADIMFVSLEDLETVDFAVDTTAQVIRQAHKLLFDN